MSKNTKTYKKKGNTNPIPKEIEILGEPFDIWDVDQPSIDIINKEEKDDKSWLSDRSEYHEPDDIDEYKENPQLLDAAERTWFFWEDIEQTFVFYNKALQRSPWLPHNLRKLFAFTEDELTIEVQPKWMNDLRKDLRSALLRPDFGLTRKCFIAFFGDPYWGCGEFKPRHYLGIQRFLNRGLSRFQREQVLYTLLVNIYWRVAKETSEEPKSFYQMDMEKIYKAWKRNKKEIQQEGEKRFYDWDLNAQGKYGFLPSWPTIVALWWVAQDRTIFPALCKRPDLPVPPRLKEQNEALRFLNERFLSGQQRINSLALWATYRSHEPFDAQGFARMNEVLYCYEPYSKSKTKEFVDLLHLAKKEWRETYPVMFLRVEEYISTNVLETRFHDKNLQPSQRNYQVSPTEMGEHAFSYLLFHPFSRTRFFLIRDKEHPYRKTFDNEIRRENKEEKILKKANPSYRYSFPQRKNFAPRETFPLHVGELTSDVSDPEVNGILGEDLPFPPPKKKISKKKKKKVDEPRLEVDYHESMTPSDSSSSDPDETEEEKENETSPGKALPKSPGGKTIDKSIALKRSNLKEPGASMVPLSSTATEKEQLEWYQQFHSKTMGSFAPMASSTSTAHVFSTGTEMYLVGPKTGTSWKDFNAYNELLKFKANLAIMNKRDDLQWRINHMDEDWCNHLDIALIHLDLLDPPIHWTQLNDKEFFNECDKVFGDTKTLSGSSAYTSRTLYTEHFNAWLKEIFSESRQLWNGQFESSKNNCTEILSSYNILATQYTPTASEKTEEAESLRLLDMRKAIHRQALKSQGNKPDKQASLNFMLQVDATVKPGYGDRTRFKTADINTLACREITQLIDSTQQQAAYVSRVPLRGVSVADYLRTALIVMHSMHTIMLQAYAIGMREAKSIKASNEDETSSKKDRSSRGKSDKKKDLSSSKKKDSKDEQTRPVQRKRERSQPRKEDKGTEKQKHETNENPTNRACYMCGRNHKGECHFKDHPDANHNKNVAWVDSKYGKMHAKRGFNSLAKFTSLADPQWKPTGSSSHYGPTKEKEEKEESPNDDEATVVSSTSRSTTSKSTKSKGKKKTSKSEPPKKKKKKEKEKEKNKRKSTEEEDSDCKSTSTSLNTLNTKPQHNCLITCTVLSTPSRILDRNVAVLLDTGAIDRSYVSVELGNALKKAGATMAPCDGEVSSSFPDSNSDDC